MWKILEAKMKDYIRSPMNYIGGKYKLLKQILPLIPEDIDCFYDIFCGGCNVGINVPSNKVICNDYFPYIITLYNKFQTENLSVLLQSIEDNIKKYNLSKDNQKGYLELREYYNKNKDIIDFYTLLCFSFNHQIRFNSKQEFNTPFGRERSSFNDQLKKNFVAFIEKIQNINIEFTNHNFDFFKDQISSQDFVYCDPPYLITTATYNDGKRGFDGWNDEHERKLLNFLDHCNSKKIKFALSNVLTMGDKENTILKEWSKKYKVIALNFNYNNSSYQKDIKKTEEVLIINY